MSAISKAISLIGTQTYVAKKLCNSSVRQSHVSSWVLRGQAPAKYIRKISELTNNQVSIADLLEDHERNAKSTQRSGGKS